MCHLVSLLSLPLTILGFVWQLESLTGCPPRTVNLPEKQEYNQNPSTLQKVLGAVNNTLLESQAKARAPL